MKTNTSHRMPFSAWAGVVLCVLVALVTVAVARSGEAGRAVPAGGSLLGITAQFPTADHAYLSAPPVAVSATARATTGLPELIGTRDDSWRHRLARRLGRIPQRWMSPGAVTATGRALQDGQVSEHLRQQGHRIQNEILAALLAAGRDETVRATGGLVRQLDVSYNTGHGGRPDRAGLDLMLALLDQGRSAAYGHLGYALQDKEHALSTGVGYRLNTDGGRAMLGTNVFYDFLSDPMMHRLSLGLEARLSLLDVYMNWYQAMNDGKVFADESIAYTPDGFDVGVMGRIPWVPWISLAAKYYRWNRLYGEADLRGQVYSAVLTPVPLAEVSLNFDNALSAGADWGMEGRLRYRFGVPISEQLKLRTADAYSGRVAPASRRFERPRREYQQWVQTFVPCRYTVATSGMTLSSDGLVELSEGTSLDLRLRFTRNRAGCDDGLALRVVSEGVVVDFVDFSPELQALDLDFAGNALSMERELRIQLVFDDDAADQEFELQLLAGGTSSGAVKFLGEDIGTTGNEPGVIRLASFTPMPAARVVLRETLDRGLAFTPACTGSCPTQVGYRIQSRGASLTEDIRLRVGGVLVDPPVNPDAVLQLIEGNIPLGTLFELLVFDDADLEAAESLSLELIAAGSAFFPRASFGVRIEDPVGRIRVDRTPGYADNVPVSFSSITSTGLVAAEQGFGPILYTFGAEVDDVGSYVGQVELRTFIRGVQAQLDVDFVVAAPASPDVVVIPKDQANPDLVRHTYPLQIADGATGMVLRIDLAEDDIDNENEGIVLHVPRFSVASAGSCTPPFQADGCMDDFLFELSPMEFSADRESIGFRVSPPEAFVAPNASVLIDAVQIADSTPDDADYLQQLAVGWMVLEAFISEGTGGRTFDACMAYPDGGVMFGRIPSPQPEVSVSYALDVAMSTATIGDAGDFTLTLDAAEGGANVDISLGDTGQLAISGEYTEEARGGRQVRVFRAIEVPCININIIDDGLVEQALPGLYERIVLSLTATMPAGGTRVADAAARLVLHVGDLPEINFVMSNVGDLRVPADAPLQIEEGNTEEMHIRIHPPSPEPITVFINAVRNNLDIGRDAATADISVGTLVGTLTPDQQSAEVLPPLEGPLEATLSVQEDNFMRVVVPAGIGLVTLPLVARDDTEVEGEESISIRIRPQVGQYSVDPDNALNSRLRIIVIDND